MRRAPGSGSASTPRRSARAAAGSRLERSGRTPRRRHRSGSVATPRSRRPTRTQRPPRGAARLARGGDRRWHVVEAIGVQVDSGARSAALGGRHVGGLGPGGSPTARRASCLVLGPSRRRTRAARTPSSRPRAARRRRRATAHRASPRRGRRSHRHEARVLRQPGALVVAGQVDGDRLVSRVLEQRDEPMSVPGDAAGAGDQHEAGQTGFQRVS